MQLSRIAEDMIGSEVLNQTKLPKYLRLSNAILDRIEAGEMRPGDKLPPEGALAGALPASLGTVQKALAHLKTLGVVVRDHGRGTFVAGALYPTSGDTIPVDELLHFRFADDDRATPTIAPVVGLMTDGVGRRKDPFTGRLAYHRGLDISARRGTPIQAPADGIVVFTGRNGGLGRCVRISHDFGFTTVYGHLDKILVEPGAEVHRGQEIGLLGNSGRSTGPHLHYEVHVNGVSKNPLYYILDAF